MTLDDAIKHCYKKAEELREQDGCLECAHEHEELAGWLEELKERREDSTKDYNRGYADGAHDEYALGVSKGEWIHREDMDYLDENKVVHNHFECNKCGFIHDFIDGHTSQYNFCPNCGAEMKEVEE